VSGRDLLLVGVALAAIVWLLSQPQELQSAETDLGDAGYYADQGFGAIIGDAVSATATSSDLDVMARTILGEAANQSAAAKLGVASVIMNRVKAGQGGITSVCKAPGQFDCWFPSLGGRSDYNLTANTPTSNATYQACLVIATGAVNGTLADNTGGATYYHNTTNPEQAPRAWGNVQLTTQIGAFSFYRAAPI
jgi:spore germination cell wall hydrolase CwlJ-like protein